MRKWDDFLETHGTQKGKEYSVRLRKAVIISNILIALLCFGAAAWILW